MDVMSARVRYTRYRGAVRDSFFVVDRQSIEVGPQRDHRTPGVAYDVADQSRPYWQDGGRQAGSGQFVCHQGRCTYFVPGQLGVGVDVSTQSDHLFHQAVHSPVNPLRL
jgi:hypothetical protein